MSAWTLALGGGVLIGIAATLLLWLNGRIAGISGIVYGLFTAPASDRAWRLAFLAGLMGVGGLAMRLSPAYAEPRDGFPTVLLIVAGLLVGFGTRLGSGCTSGHGVCGLGRFSLRSLVAVLTFITVAIATVFVMRHVAGGVP
jgi:uncharacterized membrane protein YedE/YeeE